MEPFTRLTAIAAPMAQDNIDTDQILPARYLMMPRDDQYKTYAFRDLRYTGENAEIPDFILNRKPFRDAKIIVAGRNFGCGSSREGAVFTLVAAGFRCVIAADFGDIFYNNAFNNGLLPVTLAEDRVAEIQERLRNAEIPEMKIDLENQTVSGPRDFLTSFEIDPHRRERLLKGLDPVGYTLQFERKIEAHETEYLEAFPWI